jgi:hypothetical protein
MTSEDRQALAKQVASMVLLQVFPPMEQQHQALILILEKIEAQTAVLQELATRLHQDQPQPLQRARPNLSVVSLHQPSGGEGAAN